MGGCQCTDTKEVGVPQRKPLDPAMLSQRSPNNNQLLIQNCQEGDDKHGFENKHTSGQDDGLPMNDQPEPGYRSVKRSKPINVSQSKSKIDGREKRGNDIDAFQCLKQLVIKDQDHTKRGYRFSDCFPTSFQLQNLKQVYLPFAQQFKADPQIYGDPKFPKNLSSLTKNPATSIISNVSQLQWKHYKEIFGEALLFQKGIQPSDIRQGSLGDCYFLCSLACLAEYSNLIERLFEYIDLENGLFLIWLCIDGEWKLIIVDGYIPVKANSNSLVFSSCQDGEKQLWVILLEKAYAKAYGCYEHIIGGHSYQAIKDLTGAPGQVFSHKKDIKIEQLWAKLDRANKMKFMMTCGTDQIDKSGVKQDGHSQSVTKEGLVAGHAYSILDIAIYKGEKLIQLRNPWGSTKWKGAWGDGSKQWTEAAKKALNYSQGIDDGIFWMPFQAYFQRYSTTAINYIRPNYFYRSFCYSKPVKNLVVIIKASQLTHGFVMIAQKDHRKMGERQNNPYNLTHLIGANFENDKIVRKFGQQKYKFQRQGCIEIDGKGINPGSEYIILVNIEAPTNVVLCTYSDRLCDYKNYDDFDLMYKYMEGIAQLEDENEKVEPNQYGFKSWITAVSDYAFYLFKNVNDKAITISITLNQTNNITLMSQSKTEMKLQPGQTKSLKGKITNPEQRSYGFGAISYSVS